MVNMLNPHVKTTLYLTRKLHDEAKIMAVLTHTSLSHLMSISLREKIDQLRKDFKEKNERKY